ncbi:MAG: hypothetical protein MJK15_01775 [Colwellia sp.]|nr:hypothetical protein [Colwellia sp.]
MTTIAIIVALLILWAIFRNKQERPKPNQESQAATKPMAPTKVKTKPVVSNADLDDSYVKFSIVGCQFYKENIVGFQHRSFHDAKLIETTYKGEYAVRVEIKGKQVGNIAKDNLPLVLKHIHDQDNEIRVIAFVDDNPSVKMCKLEVEESDFDLELVADTSSVLRMPGKLICMDSSNEEIHTT